MKINKIIFTLLFILNLSIADAATNIVKNGDFSAGGDNWILTGDAGFSFYIDSWIYGASDTPAYLSQTLDTIAGASYKLSFDYFTSSFDYFTSGNSLIIGTIWDGEIVFYDITPHDWIHLVISGLTASSDHTTLTFFNYNYYSVNIVDDISVEKTSAVPVVPSIVLFASGLLGLGFFHRKPIRA